MIIESVASELQPALRRLWQEAFGDTEEFIDLFFSTIDAKHGFAATQDGQVMGALYWFDCSCRGKPVAYLYGVATAKAFRGQGVCRKLMAHLHEHLQQRGYVGVVLVPGEESLFSFYAQMGYEAFGCTARYSCRAAKAATALQSLTAEEYAKLRRQRLPAGGVLQEGRGLAFLARQAQFYAGEGFLLAARMEKGRLVGLELLGDKRQCPGIVRALGASEGVFRSPGLANPGAMYLPLSGDLAPTYFAFAFD